ncbi:MAG: hypothetical protein OIF50_13225, partial [Flavobacteriaceae bacterium]|nr:hypothetical protein [Flavobacteriaceae bacterium]
MFRTLLFALLFFGTFSYGQKGAALPNNCTSAIEVCGSEVIVSNSSGTGTQELSASNTCSSQEHNSLWLRLEIIQGGTLGFDLTPESNDIEVDYDFFLFGPKIRCDSIGQAIRCSTTNPAMANLSHNRTGMKNSEGDTSEGPGPNGNSYVKSVDVLPGEVYFLVIDRPIGNSPFQLEWTGSATQGSGAFKEGPTANKAPDLERCSISGIADFDLSAQNTSINTNSSMQISYHDSRADAIDNIDSLPNTYTSNKPLQEIFARVFNPLTKCFSISSFTLRVRGAPNIATPTPLQVCDSNANNTEIFDLNRKNIEILNGLSAASNTISFHATEAEANIRANPLPLLYNSGEIT